MRIFITLLILSAGIGRGARSCFAANQTAKEAKRSDLLKADAATPVSVGHVVRTNFPVFVTGPGRTASVEAQKVVAPFSGTLLKFSVAEGDIVRAHQTIGEMLSENSAAALEGARQMLQSAHTRGERADARRALEIAKRSRVTGILRVGEAGVVTSIGADEGERVPKDQVLLSVAPRSSIAFLAEIDQAHLARVHPNLQAEITLVGAKTPLVGKVHAVLPAASASDLRSPVRIDFSGIPPPNLGVFGTVKIIIGEDRGALAVPDGAILRDDVHAKTKVAVVSREQRASWLEVETGISARGLTEILSPELRVGEPVIVDGQVGLAENTSVRVAK